MRIDGYKYRIGESLAGFVVKALAGRGGSGEIYIVADATGQIFAVKICYDARGMEKEGIIGVRNIEETPGLLRIYQAGSLAGEGTFGYVMPAADNVLDWPQYEPDSLARRICLAGPAKAAEIFPLMAELLQGVAAIHKAGYVHRDIKPENILFFRGRPCLADFGLLCPVNRELPVAGTPGYIPPEYLGKSCRMTAFSQDFYALGKVMYAMWSGRDAAEYPSLPSAMDLQEFVCVHACYERACADRPSLRPQSVDDFHALLQRAGRGRRTFPKRLCLAALLVLVAAALMALGWWWLRGHVSRDVLGQEKGQYATVYEEPLFSTAQEVRIFRESINPESNPLIREFSEVLWALDKLPPFSSGPEKVQRYQLERRKDEIMDDKRFRMYALSCDLRRHQLGDNQEGYCAARRKIRDLMKDILSTP